MDVHGKSAIITDGGSGINLSLARLLLTKSCSILIADLTLTPSATSLLTQPHPGGAKCLFKRTDVTDWKQLSSLFLFALSAGLGVPDIVVAGAGIFEPEWIPRRYLGGRNFTVPNNRRKFRASHKTHSIGVFTFPFGREGESRHDPYLFHSRAARVTRDTDIFGDKDWDKWVCASDGTPLWEEHSEKLKMFEEGKDVWVEPEEVAEAMLRLIEDPELKGGTILEVGKGTRVVEYFGDLGPMGGGLKGHSLRRVYLLDEEMIEVLRRERDGAKGGEV
ncbi:hypothetical protein BDD12DRAFT_907437 [Trichophaea hybrida]|nr:hypothetical protein BDD12DRAFT_907437 [Trichophaea hybrida]